MLAKWHEYQLCEYSEADKLHVSHVAAMGHRRALIHAIDIHVIVLYSFSGITAVADLGGIWFWEKLP